MEGWRGPTAGLDVLDPPGKQTTIPQSSNPSVVIDYVRWRLFIMAKVKSKSKPVPVHAVRENMDRIGFCIPPGSITRPTTTFANHVYTIKITQ